MQKVVNISLNGIAYQLEEPGYNQLRAYLERAEARLKDSPDRTEVMADLEQAIGEKCRARARPAQDGGQHLGSRTHHRGDGPGGIRRRKGSRSPEPPASRPPVPARSRPPPPPRKRLFQIREGAMWMGVCNGIAAYLNVDVTWVRIAFVLLTIFSSGVVVPGLPGADVRGAGGDTPEDRAAAFGMPFSTEELISRAKKNFEEFGAASTAGGASGAASSGTGIGSSGT